MATPYLIPSAGEATVTATGVISGSLNTTALIAGQGFLHLRVRNLPATGSIRVQVEDTASASAFSDALTVFVYDFPLGQNPDGDEVSIELNQLPSLRIGAANNALRLNVTAISSSTTCQVLGWITQ